jgi:serine O-acetyltransferase
MHIQVAMHTTQQGIQPMNPPDPDRSRSAAALLRDCDDAVLPERAAGDAVVQWVAGALMERAHLADIHRPLPDASAVATAMHLYRRLLFPEVFTGGKPTLAGLTEDAAALFLLLEDLLLCERLARPGRERYGAQPGEPCGQSTAVAAQWAHETAQSVMERLPWLREQCESDVQAALDGDPAARSRAEIILCYPGFDAIATYRLAHSVWLADGLLVARMMAEQAHQRTGIDLHPGATIGPALFIDHGTGVVVGETAHIGARVRLYQGVTLGARSISPGQTGAAVTKRHPTLEDDVVIYANATILGGDVIIGKGAIVGGNTWVTTSVPAGARMRIDVAARVAEAVVMVPHGAQPE